MNAIARTFRFARAALFVAATFLVACSDEIANDGDSAAPRSDANSDAVATDLPADDISSDAGATDLSADDAPSDGAATDSSFDLAVLDGARDALSDEATSDGDGACACTLVDSGLPAPVSANGIMSLPCYCAMPWPGLPGAAECASYEVATRCDAARRTISVETYTNCNLVTVKYENASGVTDARVYDHTTHELVGAFRGTDHSIPCGASLAFMIFSGIVPGPECQTAKIEWPCADAGRVDGAADVPPDDAADGAPPDDADGGCVCEPDGQQGGRLSLSCYCTNLGCPTYDQALTRCGSDSPPEVNRVEDHEACNLVVITSGTSAPGGGRYVFDRTTHDLVGILSSADYPAFMCGDASVFGYRAGMFPPPGCAVSRSVPRCPRDGG